MPDKAAIIDEVRSALDSVANGAGDAGRGDNRNWWTKQVMTALCRWGITKGKGSWVGAARVKNRRRLERLARRHEATVEGEWLYDFTCLKYNADLWLKRVVLVAECEWGNVDDINNDFEKLLLARADVRVMIFDGQQSDPSETIGIFRRYIRKCEHTCVGDTWLFAARLHDGDGEAAEYRFDYRLFVA